MKIYQVDFITDKFQHAAIVSAMNESNAKNLINEKFGYVPFMEIVGIKEMDINQPNVIYHETIYPF
jgi:hypothetical protein